MANPELLVNTQDIFADSIAMNQSNHSDGRVTIHERDGLTVYSASAWPGWRSLGGTLFVYVVLVVILLAMLLFLHNVTRALDDFSGNPWINRIVRFFVIGAFDLGFMAALGLALIWIPYFVLYQLSPKEFWIEGRRLCHRVWLLGFIRRTRRVDFERILDVKVSPSGSLFHLVMVYRMKLPRLIHIIIVYWSEKPVTWPLTLVSAIPTRNEAEQIQRELLEIVTEPDSDSND